GAFALFLPELASPAQSFAHAFALAAAPDWRPVEGQVVALPTPAVPPRAVALRGLVSLGARAVPASQLERLDELLRGAARQGAGGGAVRPARSARPMAEEAVRADVWLWRARFCKTRSLAARLIEAGRVRLTRAGQETRLDKPARTVKPGDALVFAIGGRLHAV